MQKLILMLILIFHTSLSYAAFEFKDKSGSNASLGYGVSLPEQESLGIFYNPGISNNLNNIMIQTSFIEVFGFRELAQNTSAIVFPYKNLGNIGFGYTSFGKMDFYKEEQFIINHSFNLNKKIVCGYNLKYMILKIKDENNYDYDNILSIDIGIIAKTLNDLDFGLSLRNVNKTLIGKENIENIYSDINIGFTYKIKEFGNAYFEASKIEGYLLCTRFGTVCDLIKNFKVRGGMQFNPDRVAVGFGFLKKRIKLDYSVIFHSCLDLQHIVSLGYML